jgi:hypothetical protein
LGERGGKDEQDSHDYGQHVAAVGSQDRTHRYLPIGAYAPSPAGRAPEKLSVHSPCQNVLSNATVFQQCVHLEQVPRPAS